MSITYTLLDIHRNYQLCMDRPTEDSCKKLFKLYSRLQGKIENDFNNIITQWNTEVEKSRTSRKKITQWNT
jgi:hypothetical protein